MSLTAYFQILRRIIKRPRAGTIAGLAAVLLACFYVYLLGAQVTRGIADPVASWAVSVGQPTVTPSSRPDSTSTPSPTATRTAAPTSPTGSPTATPTYTPISYTPTPAFIVYSVQAGDTLSGIARRYDTTTEAIMEINSLRSDLLSIGQELLIPGRRQSSTRTPTPTAPS